MAAVNMANRGVLDSVGSEIGSEADCENQNTINKNGIDGNGAPAMAGSVMSALWAKKKGANWAENSFKRRERKESKNSGRVHVKKTVKITRGF